MIRIFDEGGRSAATDQGKDAQRVIFMQHRLMPAVAIIDHSDAYFIRVDVQLVDHLQHRDRLVKFEHLYFKTVLPEKGKKFYFNLH